MIRTLLVALAVTLAFLAFTNPTENQFRANVQEREGIGGWLGLKLADLLSAGPRAGIRRDNFIFVSRFYVGGDGVLPRKDLAWGIAGRFIDIEQKDEPVSRY